MNELGVVESSAQGTHWNELVLMIESIESPDHVQSPQPPLVILPLPVVRSKVAPIQPPPQKKHRRRPPAAISTTDFQDMFS